MTILLTLTSSFLFYIIPVSVGKLFYNFLGYFIKEKNNDSLLLQIPLYFALGSLFLFFFRLLNLSYYFEIVYLLFFVSLIINLGSIRNIKKFLSWNTLLLLLGSLILSIITFFIWNYKSPFDLNWDLYEHQLLASLIQEGNFSFFTSQISDTFGFNSYPPLFHIILANSQYLFNKTPTFIMDYWRMVSFLHLYLFSLASFLFGWIVSKNRWVATINMIIATLTFESIIAFTSLFLLPQTLTSLIFLFSFVYLVLNRKVSFWKVSILILYLVLNHYVVGTLAAVIILGLYLYYRFKEFFESTKVSITFIFSFIILSISGLFFSYFFDLGFINKGEASLYVFSLMEKLKFLLRVYGYSLFILLPIGLLSVLKNKDRELKLTVLLSIGFISILVSQFPYVIKFYVLGRSFILLLMSLGLWTILSKINSRLIRVLSILIFSISLLIVLSLNSFYWKKDLRIDKGYSHITSETLQASLFLQNNYSSQTLILSDPTTQYLLEGLSSVNSIGGAFTEDEYRDKMHEFLTKKDMKVIDSLSDKLYKKPEQKLLVLSGRTFVWRDLPKEKRLSFDFNIWLPHPLSPDDINFIKSLKLTPIYQDNFLVILKLN